MATVALLKCLVSPRPSRVPVSRVSLNGDVCLNRGQMSVSVADVSLNFLAPLFQPPGTQRLLIMFFAHADERDRKLAETRGVAHERGILLVESQLSVEDLVGPCHLAGARPIVIHHLSPSRRHVR